MTKPEKKVEEEDIDSQEHTRPHDESQIGEDPAKVEEKKKTRDDDEATEVDDSSTISSASSSWEEEIQPSSRPASRPLSRAISESEVRDGIVNQRDPELGPELQREDPTPRLQTRTIQIS
ncbi:hypothetical protein NPX13_g6307 [Xylaria arbuscula]|uniref:Uncharacterized protein n=1 Tax=Xylaria arbuscula TaxID=114810 RepID=A0A9W8NC33_9PEZI|nr:hypothetical protein NPX13_g6307 [Xylaria arbuscula]